MKDLYALLDIPPDSTGTAIRAAIERSNLSQAHLEDAKHVLLDTAKRRAYDKYRSEILRVLKVRSMAGVENSENLFASGLHPAFARTFPVQTQKTTPTQDPQKRGDSRLAAGCFVLILIAGIAFCTSLLNDVNGSSSSSRNDHSPYRPPPRNSRPSAPTVASIEPEKPSADAYDRYAHKKLASMTPDEQTVINAATRLRLKQAYPLPVTGVLARTDDWKSVAFGNNSPNYSPIEIKTPRNGNYFIKIISWSSNEPVVLAFIRGGETFETYIPVGSYDIRYAKGEDWYGTTLQFGPNASYARCDEIMFFSSQYGHSIELIQQVGGNLETENLSEDDF